MRIPSSVFAATGKTLALLVIAGSIVILSGQRSVTRQLTPRDKAYFAPEAAVQYVNPGLNFSVVSANIASDGTISVDYKVTDTTTKTALALDIAGIQTPGTIAPRFIAAYIPKGQEEFVAYTTSILAAATGPVTATVAAAETAGVTTTVAVGEYIYTFKTKAPAGFDPSLTNRIGIYGSRNLTQFDMGTFYASTTFDFVPNGSATPSPRDVVKQADCNACHSTLSFHGGSRVGVDLCIMCHTQQTTDPTTGNSLDMKVLIHKIHMGASLPSVKIAKQPYQVYGFNGYSDWSSVVYPSNPLDPRDCAGSCHNPKNGAAQTNVWLTKPSRAACGSCHDDANFVTGGTNFNGGKDHVGLPQVDDTQCAGCHIPEGELPFDASIIGAHTNPTNWKGSPGMNVVITNVTNGTAGKQPTVSFTITDNAGNGIPMASLTASPNRLAFVMAGPTSDYGYTSFGADVTTPGYVSENPVPKAQCSAAGACTYTFTHAVPANAKGSYAMGVEGRRAIVINPGTNAAVSSEYGAKNMVYYFSVDGSKVAPRRTVVSINSCNQCHTKLSLHGENRNQIEMCVLCHNPSEGDESVRGIAVVADDRTQPTQGINFAGMVHRIHTGEKLAEAGLTYTIVGFGGSHNDFSDVRYPAMLNGNTGDTANCSMCHVNGSEAIFPIGKNNVLDPQGLLSPAPATTAACTACHFDTPSFAHAVLNTDARFGESCTVCHAADGAFSVIKEHAGR